MSPVHKLPRATLEQKIQILNYYHESGKPQSETVENFKSKFSISTSSFSEWLKNEQELRDRYNSSNLITKNSKRKVKFKYEKINQAMDALVKKRLQDSLPINEPILREYWSIYAHQYGVDDPKRLVSFSHGWLSQFKKRHGLDRKSMNGENSLINLENNANQVLSSSGSSAGVQLPNTHTIVNPNVNTLSGAHASGAKEKLDDTPTIDEDYLPLVERDERYTPYEVNQLLNSNSNSNANQANAASNQVHAHVHTNHNQHLHQQAQQQSQNHYQNLYNNSNYYPYRIYQSNVSTNQVANQNQSTSNQAQPPQPQSSQNQNQTQFYNDSYNNTLRNASNSSNTSTPIASTTAASASGAQDASFNRQNSINLASSSRAQKNQAQAQAQVQVQIQAQPQVQSVSQPQQVNAGISIEATDIERFIYMFADKFFQENTADYPTTKKMFEDFKNSFFNERMINLRNTSGPNGRVFEDFFLRTRNEK